MQSWPILLLSLPVCYAAALAPRISDVSLQASTRDFVDACTDPPLHTAIMRNETDIVNALILNGEDLYEENCDGLRPMELAIKANNNEIIRTLASFKFDFRSRNRFGDTVLHTAVSFAKTGVLRWFIAERLVVELDAVNKKNETPLFLSVLLRRRGAYDALVQSGAKLDFRLPGGDTYVHHSSKIANVRTLLVFAGLNVSVDAVNNEDETAMSVAVRTDKPALANVILSQGADFRRKNGKGETYIHIAVRSGSVNALRTLLRRHTLVDEEDSNGETPMNAAVQINRVDLAKLLLDFGSDVRRVTTHGRTYLHIAVQNKSTDAIRLLLESGIPADAKDSSGHTPSSYAVSSDFAEALEVLKPFGADLNITWSDSEWGSGVTLLHKAAAADGVKAIKWLVANGIPVNATTNRGSTALHVATEHGSYEAVELLLDLGICINCLHYSGGFHLTAYHMAKGDYRLRRIAELLVSRGGTDI